MFIMVKIDGSKSRNTKITPSCVSSGKHFHVHESTTVMDLSEAIIVCLELFNFEIDTQLFWVLFVQTEQNVQI